MLRFASFLAGLLLTYLTFLAIGDIENYQLYAVISIFLNIAIWSLIEWREKSQKHPAKMLAYRDVVKAKNYEIVLIQISLVFFSLLNLYIVMRQTDFKPINESLRLDFKSFTIYTSVPLVIAAQFGGWFYQAILIYLFLDIILSYPVKFKYIFKLLGIAYVGFLFSAVAIFILNAFFLKNKFYELQEMKQLLSHSFSHIAIAKFGDFLTSTLVSIGIYNYASLSFFKSIVASFMPTTLLIIVILLFRQWL